MYGPGWRVNHDVEGNGIYRRRDKGRRTVDGSPLFFVWMLD